MGGGWGVGDGGWGVGGGLGGGGRVRWWGEGFLPVTDGTIGIHLESAPHRVYNSLPELLVYGPFSLVHVGSDFNRFRLLNIW